MSKPFYVPGKAAATISAVVLACILLLAGGVVVQNLTSCTTTEDGSVAVDLPQVHVHLEAALVTLGDLANVTMPDDPELSTKITAVHGELFRLDQKIQTMMSSGIPTMTPLQALTEAIDSIEPLTMAFSNDPDVQEAVRWGALTARGILAQARIFAS